MDKDFFLSSPFTQATGMAKQASSKKMVQSFLDQSVGNDSMFRKSAVGAKLKSDATEYSMDASSMFNDSASFQLDATRQLLEPSTPTAYKQNIFNSINCLPENEAGRLATSNLYNDFNHHVLSNSTVQSSLELLNGYEQCCSNQEQFLMQMKYKTSSDVQFESIDNMCGLLMNELRTWRLLSCLYQDKIQEDALNASMKSMDDPDVVNENEQRIIDLWFRENSDIRRAQSVVDWLEKNASSEIKLNEEKLRFFHDNVSWENTLHFLKQNKLKGTSDNSELIVSEMDPDAPERQKRKLINLDKNDEILLLKHVFAFVRAGKVKEAQEMCIACGQSWRAASLEGWKLYADPNMVSKAENNIESIMGNPLRDLWKNTAWHMSLDESLNAHERAIYGTFSGNLKPILNVSLSWEDYIWAYFKVLVDISVEKEIRNSTILKKKSITQAGVKLIELPNALWDQFNNLNTPDKIFDTIEASSNDVIQQECNELFHLIQKFIILEDTNSIIETAAMWINPTLNDEEFGPARPQVLRFLVHLILFFENLGVELDEEKCGCVIESYVNFLASNESTQSLVAYYTAALKPEKQVEVYSEFLKSINGKRAQEEFLELAYNAGLNVPSITKRVVEEIREDGINVEYNLTFNNTNADETEAEGAHVMDAEVLPEDQRLINALDWLVYDATQRPDAIKQCCTLMRSFLISSKFTAVREVFKKIPDDSIDIIYREFDAKGIDDIPDDVKNSIREYLCMKAYLTTHQTFKEWFAHFYNKKPEDTEEDEQEIKKGKKMKTLSKKIIKKQRKQSYSDKLDEWQETLDQLCNNVRDHIYNVLLFPDGGWLVDAVKINDDEKRDHELEVLRKMCIPTLCDLLLTAMEKTGSRIDECLCLCNVLTTSNENDLVKLFDKNVGRKLLKRIKDIAMNDL